MESGETLKQEINKTIASHSMWKVRLLDAIKNGTSEFSVDEVKVDNKCEFGQWLYEKIGESWKTDEHYKKVLDLHAQLHTETARILSLALDGKAEIARNEMALGSEFSKLSSKLTLALMDWKKQLG